MALDLVFIDSFLVSHKLLITIYVRYIERRHSIAAVEVVNEMRYPTLYIYYERAGGSLQVTASHGSTSQSTRSRTIPSGVVYDGHA